MSDNVAKYTKSIQIPKTFGEKGRVKILTGPESGIIYSITGSRIKIGRSEDNDIPLDDTNSSRHHAEIVFGIDGGASVNDLGSANGIFVNGNPANRAQLKSGDRVLIGDTLIEIQLAGREATGKIGVSKGVAVGPVYNIKEKARETVKDAASSAATKAKDAADIAKKTAIGNGAKKQVKMRLVLIVGVLFVFYLLMSSPPKKSKSKGGFEDILIPKTQSVQVEEKLEKESKKSADKFFREGFREYREKNYFRARANFESALQLYPNHEMAKIYLSNVFKSIEEEIDKNMKDGAIAMQNLKYRKAINHFEAVMTLLATDPTGAKYKEAKEARDEARKKMDEDDL